MRCYRQETQNRNLQRHLGRRPFMALTISFVATLSWMNPSWADDDLKLGLLRTNPESYDSKIVRVTGIVSKHELKHIRRWALNVDKCVQYFTVEDETGSMRATYKASCSGAFNSLRNRDRVTIEARFDWTPGQTGVLNVQSILAKITPSPQQ